MSGLPSPPISVFAKVVDNKTDVPEKTNPSVWMTKPEAMDVILTHQRLRLRDKFGRSRDAILIYFL